MESSKQQSIIKFFQKKTNNENQVSGTGEKGEGLALLLQLVVSYWWGQRKKLTLLLQIYNMA